MYKKGEQLDCSNYRPISLLSNIVKIIEKYMHPTDFTNSWTKINVYTERGLRNIYFTNQAFISIKEEIRSFR